MFEAVTASAVAREYRYLVRASAVGRLSCRRREGHGGRTTASARQTPYAATDVTSFGGSSIRRVSGGAHALKSGGFRRRMHRAELAPPHAARRSDGLAGAAAPSRRPQGAWNAPFLDPPSTRGVYSEMHSFVGAAKCGPADGRTQKALATRNSRFVFRATRFSSPVPDAFGPPAHEVVPLARRRPRADCQRAGLRARGG